MSKYLVSFCNGGLARLALIDGRKIERVIDIDLTVLDRAIIGITGIAFAGSQCFVAVQCFPSVLLVLDEHFNVKTVYQIDDAYDVHGIGSDGDRIIIVSTGTNQIMTFDPRNGAMDVMWTGGDSLSDTLHLNDIAVYNGGVICSHFGMRTSHAMRNGEVINVTNGKCLASCLREPHSIVVAGDDLLVLESATGDLVRFRPDMAPRRICGVHGYVRGLALIDNHYLIGKSGYRDISRHRLGDSRRAPLTHSSAAAETFQVSGVYIIDQITLSADFVDTAALGHEIYQIAALPPSFPHEITAPEVAQVVHDVQSSGGI